MTRPAFAPALLVAAGALTMTLAGCSGGSTGTDATATPTPSAAAQNVAGVTEADLAGRVQAKLEQQKVQVDDDSLSCAGQLPASVGGTVSCRFTAGQQPVDAVATVTEVTAKSVEFDLATVARPIPRTVLEENVGALLKQNGYGLDSFTCAGDLAAQVDRTQACTGTNAGRSITVTVSVLSVSGGVVNYGVSSA